MVRATMALAALVAGFGLGWSPVSAQFGVIGLSVVCNGDPEPTTITNGTDATLDLSTFTLGSLAGGPVPGEPFTLSGTLAPGAMATFTTGDGGTLNGQEIFVNGNAQEGARLATPFGTLDVLCSQGSGALPVGTAPTATATTPSGGDDLDCADFATRALAQANLDANPSDPNNIDRNDNGVACEDFVFAGETAVPQPTAVPTQAGGGGQTPVVVVPTPAPPVATTAPAPAPAAPVVALPSTGAGPGGSAPALPAMALVALMAAAGAIVAVRVRRS